MPRPKKVTPFLIYTEEWQEKYAPLWNFKRCIGEAGKSWKNMGPAERQPYEEKAKVPNSTEGHSSHSADTKLIRRTCDGELVVNVENQIKEIKNNEITVKRTIDRIVRDAVQANDLEITNFHFVKVNYFTKTAKTNIYVPAELAVSEFSLETGVNRVYHTLVDPGYTIFGQLYQTQQHCEATHKLPLPPKAMGQTDLQKIYVDLIQFSKKYTDNNKLPPMYTPKEDIPIVVSALKYLRKFDAPEFCIYPLEYLLYVLKDQTSRIASIDPPESQFITDEYFECDKFEYETCIGCEYHERIDRTKYCAQSYVTRWGFSFASYMCMDMAIDLKPGRHKPHSKKDAFFVIEPEQNEKKDSNIKKEECRDETENISLNDDRIKNNNVSNAEINNAPLSPRPSFKFEPNDIHFQDFNKECNSDASRSSFENNEQSSPSSMPSPPPAPLNLDFGYCNTVVQLENKESSPRSSERTSGRGTATSSTNIVNNRCSPNPRRGRTKRSTSRNRSPWRNSSREHVTYSPRRAHRAPNLHQRRAGRSTSKDRHSWRTYSRDYDRPSPNSTRRREKQDVYRASRSASRERAHRP